MENSKPNYIKIFEDIIAKECPERRPEFANYLSKENLSIIDVIKLNNKIFGVSNKETLDFNQKHRSYDSETIIQMLTYQEEQKLNNVQLANHFRLSRNTVSKWRRLYLKDELL